MYGNSVRVLQLSRRRRKCYPIDEGAAQAAEGRWRRQGTGHRAQHSQQWGDKTCGLTYAHWLHLHSKRRRTPSCLENKVGRGLYLRGCPAPGQVAQGTTHTGHRAQGTGHRAQGTELRAQRGGGDSKQMHTGNQGIT